MQEAMIHYMRTCLHDGELAASRRRATASRAAATTHRQGYTHGRAATPPLPLPHHQPRQPGALARLMKLIGREELIDDPRFRDP